MSNAAYLWSRGALPHGDDTAFIVRVVNGQERRAIVEADRRVTSAWMPFSFESTRPQRKRRARVTVRPIMGYMFCIGNADQRQHLLKHRSIFGPTWFIPEVERFRIAQYMMAVEAQFDGNLLAWRRNARLFHCQFKKGQTVRLKQEGLDLFQGKFKAVNDDGTYYIEAEVMGQVVRVNAEPESVIA